MEQDVIGLLPAAGQATRIAPLPCSKELYPIGFRTVHDGGGVRPKVACHYLLEKMRVAGVTKAYFILRQGKWDIPGYLGNGEMVKMRLGYLMMGLPFGTPYTLDQAYPFVQHSLVAFGFPDIIFGGHDAFVKLLACQAATAADLVLGLFPADRPATMDMVDVADDGEVRAIIIKPPVTDLKYAWIIAVWTPVFTCFMHEFLQQHQAQNVAKAVQDQSELSVGHVLQAARQDGLRLHSVLFSRHTYIDIGTPSNLIQAVYDKRLSTLSS